MTYTICDMHDSCVRYVICTHKPPASCSFVYVYVYVYISACTYGVATMSRRLKIIGLFCRISSLL